MKAMKFLLKSTSTQNGRKGIITGISGKPDLQFETPALMMYTKGGCIPHLTGEVLEMLTKEKLLLQSSLLSTVHMEAAVKEQGKGFLHFTAMDDHVSFITFQDPTADVPLGKFETDKMPLWTRKGKRYLDADTYMDVIESFKPHFYGVLSDTCTNATSSKKRAIKSVDHSETMLERCLQRHKKSEYLSKNSSILGVVVGGFNENERKRCIKTLLEHSNELDGFILDGINYEGTQIKNIQFDEINKIVSTVTDLLPEDKIRIAQGCWNPVTLIDLIQKGWDVFDSTYPYLATERGCGLTFNFDIESKKNQQIYEIDLTEKRYKDDLTPVLEDCKCLCCKKYTKAYINHLINTRELLASVLLTIHNLHHYMKFFEAIQQHSSQQEMTKLKNLIHSQYSSYLKNKKDICENDKINIAKPKRRFSSSGSECGDDEIKDAIKT